MRIAMYYNNRDIRIEEISKPDIGDKELLVRVMASGICGTDVLEWYRLNKAPLVLGHEITGDVVEVGAGVERYKVGDRVFVLHHIPCDNCYYCLNGHHTACSTLHTTAYFPGGFSEYIQVPSLNVEKGIFILPDNVSYEEGIFIEPLACVIRGQRRVRIREGQCVLILGSGVSGLLHLLLAKKKGARQIIMTDINEYRLNAAGKLGANAVINANQDIPLYLRKINQGRLADVVIISTSAISAFVQGLMSVERGGTVLFFASTRPNEALPLYIDKFWRNEIILMTSYGCSPSDAKEALGLISSGVISVTELITHRLGLEEINFGFQLVAKADESLKVIITPHNKENLSL